jgi:hypothetical protein
MRNYAFALAIIGSSAWAGPAITSPAQVSAAIERQGAATFLASLSADDTDRLMDKIGSGRSEWIALAPKLAEGADAGNAEGLGIELAYALPKNPRAVLSVVDPLEGDGHILEISRVCGIPFIETVPAGYKVKALRAVRSVTDPRLRDVKARCIKALQKS